MLCIDERIKFIRDRLQAHIDQILHGGCALLAEADSDVSRLGTITYGIVWFHAFIVLVDIRSQSSLQGGGGDTVSEMGVSRCTI